jgi:RHS repeat-associated protein
MPGRQFNNGNYRYGFNGKENDNEVKGIGNQQDYGERIYDTRLARFLSVDPLTKEYPYYSPYHFAGNTPIQAIDRDGLEPASTVYQNNSYLPKTYQLASSTIQYKISDNAIIKGAITPPAPPRKLTPSQIESANAFFAKQPASGRIDYSPIDPVTDVMLGGVFYKTLTKSSLANDAAKLLPQSNDEMIKLYRGVNESHAGFDDAINGVAKAKGGTASAAEHNAGNTNSPFISFTTDPDVAKNFALRPSGNGVVLEVTVPKSTLIKSPSAKDVVLKQSGKVVNESEVLLKEKVKGATVTEVKN